MITKRNIILLTLTALFIGLNFMFLNFFIEGKIKTIKKLETAHKDVNEKYITAQILSQKLDHVYNIFENNLAFKNNDKLNEEANMEFLKSITDIMETNEIKLSQIIPGKKEKKGSLIYIPYVLEFECDYNKLGNLIVALEGNDRYIFIENITLRNGIQKMSKTKRII